MSIKGVAVILPPGDPVWRGDDHAAAVTTEDGSDEIARQELICKFANTVLGEIFPKLDTTDAWNLWQIAEKNGFQIKTFNNLPILLEGGSRV